LNSPQLRTALAAAICAALVLSTLAVFWGLRSHGFIMFDDNQYVVENPQVKKGLSGETVAWAFTTTKTANWHPVTWLSHMLDVQLFGMDAGKHHLTSLLLHCVNAVLLLLLLFRMTGALWRSAFVAALFALHPLHVESVAWIAERKDVLSTLFWLLTLGAWLGFVRSRKPAWYLLAVLLYALGLMTKPMLVTLPFTLLLLDLWPLRRLTFPPQGLALPLKGQAPALRGLLAEKIPFFALSAASCVVTFIAQRSGGAVQPLENFSLAGRLANAVWAYAAYLLKTFWPSDLSVYYPLPADGHPAWQVALAALLLLGLSAGALRLAGRTPHLLFGWLWYLGTLVPVIGLVQVGDQVMADRYTYIPLVGLFVAAAWGIGAWAGKNPLIRVGAAGAATAALLALSAAAHAQVRHWSDSRTLFERVLAVTTDNYLFHNNLGVLNFEEGKTEEAIAHIREAIRLRPYYEQAHDNLGAVLLKAGKAEEAIAHFREAIRIRPDYAQAHDDLGAALVKAGKLEEASEHCREALRSKPENAGLNARMAAVLAMLNRGTEAGGYLERALTAGANSFDDHYSLGMALQVVGRLHEAAEHCERALEMKPDSALALTCLGQVQGRMGRHSEASACLEKAARLDPNNVNARINLGVALDRAGRVSEALEQFEMALRLESASARVLNHMGLALGKLNRLKEATGCFEKAAKLDPGYADAYANLGAALGKLDRLGEAIAFLEKAVMLDPRRAETRINLGTALDDAGRTSEALEQFREALRIRPDHAQARAAMENILNRRREGR
jgi:tetratricopeptide (TPR) repeat protein